MVWSGGGDNKKLGFQFCKDFIRPTDRKSWAILEIMCQIGNCGSLFIFIFLFSFYKFINFYSLE